MRVSLRGWRRIITLAVIFATSSCAQQSPGSSPSLTTQIFDTFEHRIRVVPMHGLARPWALAFLPDGDILITERAGRLRIVRKGVLDPQPISGIPPVVDLRLKGLNDIAVHPRFVENKLVYFTYYKPKPGSTNVATAALGRGRFDGGAVLEDVRDLFVADAWTSEPSASRIVFGRDDKIYMTIGVPFRGRPAGEVNAEDAQNPSSYAGKVLRLNDDGSVPSDNPFVGHAGYKPEIYALGIRNVLGLVVHPASGELWENENGPRGGDEINIIRAGRNYGWPIISYGGTYLGELEGFSGPSSEIPFAQGLEQPLFYWVPAIAVSGMTIYTGDRFSAWKGNILVGGLRSAQLQRVVLDQRGLPVYRESMLTELKLRIREVRQGPDGFVYLLGSSPAKPGTETIRANRLSPGQPPVEEDDETGVLLRLEPVVGETATPAR
jgi:glucose/arabinose dehydrogenase